MSATATSAQTEIAGHIAEHLSRRVNLRHLLLVEASPRGESAPSVLRQLRSCGRAAGESSPPSSSALDLLHVQCEAQLPEGSEGASFQVHTRVAESRALCTSAALQSALLRESDGALLLTDATGFSAAGLLENVRLLTYHGVRPLLLFDHFDQVMRDALSHSRAHAPTPVAGASSAAALKVDPQLFARLNCGVRTLDACMRSSAREREREHEGESEAGDQPLATSWELDPRTDTVVFGSAQQGWGFTLRSFARLYATRLGLSEQKVLTRLWGDHFYDVQRKRWSGRPVRTEAGAGEGRGGRDLVRGFDLFVLKPLLRLAEACEHAPADPAPLNRALQRLGMQVPAFARAACGTDVRALFDLCMRSWLPIGPSLVSLCVRQCPSPPSAQARRALSWCRGETHDDTAAGIRDCDPFAPLCVSVSGCVRTARLLPLTSAAGDHTLRCAVRVLSGTLRSGDRVRLLTDRRAVAQGAARSPALAAAAAAPEDERSGAASTAALATTTPAPAPSSGESMLTVSKLFLMTGGVSVELGAVPAGGVCQLALLGDARPPPGSTICTSRHTHALTATAQYRLAVDQPALVCAELEPRNLAHLPPLIALLRELRAEWPSLAYELSYGGASHLLFAPTYAELVSAYEQLWARYPLQPLQPFVCYRETVTERSPTIMCKAPNKHTRVYMRASPIALDITAHLFGATVDLSRWSGGERALVSRLVTEELLAGERGPRERRLRLWALSRCGSLLVENCSVQYLHEIKDSGMRGFEAATMAGPLAEEPLLGVRFDVVDMQLTCDAIHRGGGQIIPTYRRCCFGAALSAAPRLLEPIYALRLASSLGELGKVYCFLNVRRGRVQGVEEDGDRDLATIHVELPCSESFHLDERLPTSCAVLSIRFSHWQEVPGDPLQEGSLAYQLVGEIRARKGIRPRPLPVNSCSDTL
jgi:elongation factor 2